MIDDPAPTYPFVPMPYRIAVGVSVVLIIGGVSMLNLPIWVGALLTGGLLMAEIGILQAALRWRWRASKKGE